jgi:hypothetical protein
MCCPNEGHNPSGAQSAGRKSAAQRVPGPMRLRRFHENERSGTEQVFFKLRFRPPAIPRQRRRVRGVFVEGPHRDFAARALAR